MEYARGEGNTHISIQGYTHGSIGPTVTAVLAGVSLVDIISRERPAWPSSACMGRISQGKVVEASQESGSIFFIVRGSCMSTWKKLGMVDMKPLCASETFNLSFFLPPSKN